VSRIAFTGIVSHPSLPSSSLLSSERGLPFVSPATQLGSFGWRGSERKEQQRDSNLLFVIGRALISGMMKAASAENNY